MPLTAAVSAVAELRAGRTRLTTLRSQVPLSLRETLSLREGTAGLTVLASAFGPLGGDRTSFRVDVGAGARLTVGSAAAQVAQPGSVSAVSEAATHLRVAKGGELHWQPQPLVVTAGAEHRVDLLLDVAVGGHALVVDTVVLGRGGEAPGRYRARWRVSYDGRPLLHTDLDAGTGAPAGWDGPAVVGDARVLVSVLLVGRLPEDPHVPAGELLRLAGPGLLLSWLGSDPIAADRAVRAFLAQL